MINSQAQQFGDEIQAVIDKWKDKVNDDCITYIEMYGVLHMHLFALSCEAHHVLTQEDIL